MQRTKQPSNKATAKPSIGVDTATDERPNKPDDYALAKSWLADTSDKLAYFHFDWHKLGLAFWEIISDGHIKRDIADFMARQYVQVNAGKVESVAKLIRWNIEVSDHQIKQANSRIRQYIPLADGTSYNLKTHETEPTPSDLFFTAAAPFTYDKYAQCPNFIRFLETSLVYKNEVGRWVTDDDMVTLCLEMMGYCLTADTHHKAMFWLSGESDSGKSQLVSIIKALAGQFHTTLNLNLLKDSRFMLAALVGKRVVTCTEADSDVVLPDGIIKTIVGGEDDVSTDVKNKDAISFKNEAKIVWAMNKMPMTTDRSGAIQNRMNVILFPRTFPKGSPERIENLHDILVSELAGIFNLCMMSFRNMGKHFTAPRRSVDYIQQYRETNDTEATFVIECCERGAAYSINSSDLYIAFKVWAESNGFKPKNINRLAEEWRRLGFESKRESGGNRWFGLRLKTFQHGGNKK